jgi:hypothetical protein
VIKVCRFLFDSRRAAPSLLQYCTTLGYYSQLCFIPYKKKCRGKCSKIGVLCHSCYNHRKLFIKIPVQTKPNDSKLYTVHTQIWNGNILWILELSAQCEWVSFSYWIGFVFEKISVHNWNFTVTWFFLLKIDIPGTLSPKAMYIQKQ